MNRLDDHIRRHYADKTLPEDRLNRMLASKKPSRARWPFWAVAALLILGLFSLHTYWQTHQLTQRVFAEVAMNHSKRLSVEVASNHYADLQTHLNRLDFPIRPVTSDMLNNHDLLGGRYCSIQGHLAAQLKLKHKKTGDIKTLYVTRLTESLSDIAPQTSTTSGVTIHLWKTDSRLFALASDQP